jgi:hypothetical protein
MQQSKVQQLVQASLKIAERPQVYEQLINEIEGYLPLSIANTIITPLRELTLEDIGVNSANYDCYFVPDYITYTEIHSSPLLWLGFFSMTQGCKFPLHDHPAMAGFTKAVVGSILYKSVDIESHESGESFAVRNITDGVLIAPDVMTISPRAGNIHELTFTENTVMFDIFIPNYGEGRDCCYYSFQSTSKAVVSRTDEPHMNFREHPYEGPRLGVA